MSRSAGFGRGRFERGKRVRECAGRNTAAATPPAYHLDVRRVVVRALQGHAELAEGLARDELVASLCDACDAAASEGTVDKDALRRSVDSCLRAAAVEADNIAETLAAQWAEVVLKTMSSVLLTENNNNNHEEGDRVAKGRHGPKGSSASEGGNEAGKGAVVLRQGILPTPLPLPSVFALDAVCSVQCLTFQSLPRKYCVPEVMKHHLEQICARIPKSYFLNVRCIPGEGCAIVSFNSNETAAAVMFMVNSSDASSITGDNHVDTANTINTTTTTASSSSSSGSSGTNSRPMRITVVEADEAHQKLLWGPLVEQRKKLEEGWSAWHSNYMAHPPHEIRQKWSGARTREHQLNQELQQLPSNHEGKTNVEYAGVSNGTIEGGQMEEKLRRKLEILRSCLECKQIISQAEEEMRILYGDAYKQYLLNGPMESAYSSSQANVSNESKLLFISDLPRKLDDAEILWFLQNINVRPVYIWRDPTKDTSICVELPTAGNVFGVLRQLDGSGMRLAGALFSRERRVT